MAEDEDSEQEPVAKGSSKKLVTIIVIAVVVIAATVGGLFAAGIIGGGHAGDETEDGEEESEEPAGPAIYIKIDPAFVVNFNETSKARFLQITMEAMTRNPDVPKQIETHLPAIRNNLVLLFSSQSYESMSTLEGKEALREEALTVVQEILEQETGDVGIEAVYFTSIVMQ